MRERTSQVLYAYWNEMRGFRIAPKRFEIEPSRIAAILPDTFILERLERKAYAFRLAGTRICEIFARELRGTDIIGLWSIDDREALIRILESVCKEGAAGIVQFEGSDRNGRVATLELMFLPLLHTGNEITRLLGSVACGEPPFWLGDEPLVSVRIRTFNLVWPDGRPHAVIARAAGQAPFVPEPAGSRVVKRERRNFRVYEGGRSSEPPAE
ncbi:MAG: PAS domain-containing protein [Hyphomicrobiaceae bacterium]